MVHAREDGVRTPPRSHGGEMSTTSSLCPKPPTLTPSSVPGPSQTHTVKSIRSLSTQHRLAPTPTPAST